MGEAVWLLLLCVLPLGEGTFSVSRQYHRRHAERGPMVIALDDPEEPLDEPAEIFEAAKSRQARQTGDANPPQPSTTLAQLNASGETYGIVHWDGLPQTTVFILTVAHPHGNNTRNAPVSKCTLWRSTDYGATFQNESHKWPADAKANWYYISQDDDDNIIFTDQMNKRLYVTHDEGKTYRTVNLGDVVPYIVRFIPHYAPWLNTAYGQHVFVHDHLAHKLVASTDMFNTSNELPGAVTEAHWGALALDTPGVIYFDIIEGTRKVLRKSVPPYTSTSTMDFYASYFDKFWLSHEYMFVVDYSGASPVLSVSCNRTGFKVAEFPNNLPGKHYSLVDASEGQVFMAVYHDVNNTAIYISEENGQVYTLSLSHLISSEAADWESGDPTFDLHLVEGLNGVLFANQKNPSSSYGASVVSYDKGGRWDVITPPAVDSTGHTLQCTPPSCSLHFHMDTSAVRGYSGILSRESAVGLVMAQGNIGSTLSSSWYFIRLYMSTNGGYTWVEVANQRSISVYQFLDFGSLIVYSKRWSYTTVFKYSCDEGLTWSQVNFPGSTQLHVAGLLTELGERALHATVFGYKSGFSGGWYIVGLNFTGVMTHQCTDHDYTVWSPTDEHLDRECLLGVHEEFERRNTTDCCYNGVDYERPMNTYRCTCTSEDYECDYGFQRADIDSPCLAILGMQPFRPPVSCPENGTYRYPSGYRRVALDNCIVGSSSHLEPEQRTCPVEPPGELEIAATPATAGMNKEVQFTLYQLSGSKLLTKYSWDFNDTHQSTIVGYNDARHQSHFFASPGRYIVTVKAVNGAGRSFGLVEVLVQDQIASVSVIAPSHALAGVQVALRVNVTTVHSATYLPATFTWSFNNSALNATDTTTLLKAFNAGQWIIMCTVANANGASIGTTSIVVGSDGIGIQVAVTPENSVVAKGYNMSFTIEMTKFTASAAASVHVTFDNDDYVETPVSGTGETRTVTVHHAFQSIGTHNIHVTVYQEGLPAGSARLSVDVRETITDLHVYRPKFTSGKCNHAGMWTDLLNASILFEFHPFKDNPLATDFGTVMYTLDFGDGQLVTSHGTVQYHSYDHTGTFHVNITADNAVSQASCSWTITIVQAPTSATVEGLHVVEVKKDISFEIKLIFPDSSVSSSSSLAQSLKYTWTVTGHHSTQNEEVLPNEDSSIQYSFLTAGTYELSVVGYGASSYAEQKRLVTAQTTVAARESITLNVTVDYNVALVDEVITATVKLYSDSGKTTYVDWANITLSVKTGSRSLKKETKNFYAFTVLMWPFQLNSTSSSELTVFADNQVRNRTQQVPITVVEPVDRVKLGFDLPSLSVERNQVWLQQFEESIRQQLLQLLNFESWVLRVSAEDVTSHTAPTTSETFVVIVTVLPANSSAKAKEEGMKRVQQVAAVADIRHQFIVPEVDGPRQPYLYLADSSSSPSSGAIAGVVVSALVVIVALAVGLGTIIFLLYRKYRRLEYRYSRLATSGVTFDPSSDDDDPVQVAPPEGGHASVGLTGFDPAHPPDP